MKHLEKMLLNKINGNISALEMIGLIASNYSEVACNIRIEQKENCENSVKFEKSLAIDILAKV